MARRRRTGARSSRRARCAGPGGLGLRGRGGPGNGRLEPLSGRLEPKLRQKARTSAASRSSTPRSPLRSGSSKPPLILIETLFLVASKSGTTAEPNAFEKYFFDRVRSGRQFIAITDPGSSLERLAREKGYRSILHGEPEIGGRFSALSRFGLAPGRDRGYRTQGVPEEGAGDDRCLRARSTSRRIRASPLGVALGTLARAGRDKLTLFTSPEIEAFGGWLEQLVAESTGKEGKGIVPVDREAPGGSYGNDRVFAYIGIGPYERPLRSRAGGTSCPSHRARLGRWARRGVLPLGDRDRGRGLGPWAEPVRPAGRRGGESRDPYAHEPASKRQGSSRRRPLEET